MTASIFETSTPARRGRPAKVEITATTPDKPVYVLERVPLPATKAPATTDRTYLYPFRAMKVGQSFLVPVAERKGRGPVSRRITNNAQAYRRATGARFLVKSVEGGVRCWRIA